MANVKPFKAIRPSSALAAQVAALPYDVYNREEAAEKVKGHPLSFLNIDRPETQFDPSMDMYADCVYEKAKEMLDREIAEDIFVQDEQKCYYLYELTMNGRTQTGITACVSIDDYLHQVVKKHEDTRAEKEQDRIRHVDVCSAQTGPIFLTYRTNPILSYIVCHVKEESPVYDFEAEDGIRHRVWIVGDDLAVAAIEKAFAAVDALYIADGHHRAASAFKVGMKRRRTHPAYNGTEEFNYFLAVLFPEEELKIMDYNRLVKNLNGWSKEDFLERIRRDFTVEHVGKEAVSPSKKGEFGMYLDHDWYRLNVHPDKTSEDPVDGLDVSILQMNLLDPVLGIENPRTDENIEFVGGIRGLGELEKRCHEDMVVAFSMYPTSIRELLAVADAGRLMPPKSTWFEPKLRSGLFIHQIEK